MTTLRQLPTNVKERDEPIDRQGKVYQIKFFDCQAAYVSETDKNLNIGLTENVIA